MPNGDASTGKIRAGADMASHPYVMLVGLIITATSMFGGVKWGMAEIAAVKAESERTKADSAAAIQAVSKIQGAMDTFIMLQREANELKRTEMKASSNAAVVAAER